MFDRRQDVPHTATAAVVSVGGRGPLTNFGDVQVETGEVLLGDLGTLRNEAVLEVSVDATLALAHGATLGNSGTLTVAVEVDVLLAGQSTRDLDFPGAGGSSGIARGNVFDVIRYRDSLAGTFSHLDASGTGYLVWGVAYDVDLGDGLRSVRLTATAVPLPGMLGIIAGILGCLVASGRPLEQEKKAGTAFVRRAGHKPITG